MYQTKQRGSMCKSPVVGIVQGEGTVWGYRTCMKNWKEASGMGGEKGRKSTVESQVNDVAIPRRTL